MATTSVPKPAVEKGTFDTTLASARSTMMFSEILSLAVDSFRASKARFLLTMLGMVIGSASIILVVTVGLTGKQYAIDDISSLGPNKIEMQYSGGSIIGPDNTTTPDAMTREDMQAVVDTVPGIVAYSPMLEDPRPHQHGRRPYQGRHDAGRLAAVQGCARPGGAWPAGSSTIRTPQPTPRSRSSICPWPMNSTAARRPPIDQTITIKGIPLTVIGVFKESIPTYGMSEISTTRPC